MTATLAEVIKEEKSNLEEDAIPLKVPKGYLLVPEHQVNNRFSFSCLIFLYSHLYVLE